MGAELLIKTLPEIESGKASLVPQDGAEATYAGLISKADGKVDFNKSPDQIEQQIRAFDPWPGAFCDMDDKHIKLWCAQSIDKACNDAAGTVVAVSNEGIDVSCGGKLLRITELQLPGKKRVKVRDYLLGHRLETGSRFF